jgi:hypothetical protein
MGRGVQVEKKLHVGVPEQRRLNAAVVCDSRDATALTQLAQKSAASDSSGD